MEFGPLTSLPYHKKSIGCKWVFRIKDYPKESINKYKTRFVANGFHQQQDFEFHEAFSTFVKPTIIWIVFSLALTYKWEIEKIDINNAFLNGDLQDVIFYSSILWWFV